MEHTEEPKDKDEKPQARKKKGLLKRYPLVLAALVLAVLMVGGAYYLADQKKSEAEARKSFDPSAVLPPEVKPADTQTVYTAVSLRQYDGKDGHKCYVAVKGTVYEIKDSKYWQNGEHTPSGGQGICGGDMTEAIKGAPHGESMLERLQKVGTYQ